MKNNLPVVAIVGRPNVGKSSLFNFLIKKRKSIVDEQEGVTRDINMQTLRLGKTDLYLYDTAGYLEKGDSFNQLVQEKVRQAIQNADLILFMVDGREYHPIDEELARFLDQQDTPVWVLANKLDNNKMDENAYEFYNLGLETIYPISVVHNRGIIDLSERIEAMFKGLSTDKLAPEEIRVAIVGKPNVGKSRLMNHLLGYDRSIVSEIAGTTRDSLDERFEWKGHSMRLMDTAGLRRKSKVEEDIEYYSNVRAVQAIEAAEVVVLLLDATDEISHQDKRIAAMVQEKGRGLITAFNKWDLVHPGNAEDNYQQMREYEAVFRFEFPEYEHVPLEFISALDEYKIERLMDRILDVYRDYYFRVPTHLLNQWLKEQIAESRETKRISRLKIYYVTQPHEGPPRFVFFINSKKHLRKDFARFLENRLRESFEFRGVPMKITFREKPKRD